MTNDIKVPEESMEDIFKRVEARREEQTELAKKIFKYCYCSRLKG